MASITRRQFGSLAAALAAQARKAFGAIDLDQAIRESMTRHAIPCVVAMVATPDKITYTGAFGKRDSSSGYHRAHSEVSPVAGSGSGSSPIASVRWSDWP